MSAELDLQFLTGTMSRDEKDIFEKTKLKDVYKGREIGNL